MTRVPPGPFEPERASFTKSYVCRRLSRDPGKEKVTINGAVISNAHGIGAKGMRMIGVRAITKGQSFR
jgi:acetyl-CoA acetyltransferase